MTQYVQSKKQKIDVGQVGNANTGDIIYDGGVKLNTNLDALYNAFGDIRLYDAGKDGVGSQTLHAAGYFQKLPTSYYSRNIIEPGSQHDLNTLVSTFIVTLPAPKLGEQCRFINSNGSFDTNKIVFKAQPGGDIKGQPELEISQGFVMIEFTCVSDVNNASKWDYKVTPMFGDFSVPVNSTVEVTKTTPVTIPMFNKAMYEGTKLVLSASEIKAGVRERTISEVLVMIDPEDNKVYADEYSVIFKNEKIYSLEFLVDRNVAVVRVTTTKDRIKFSIKSIETIKANI